MEILFEIIILRFITRFLGYNVRYYLFKIFDKTVTKSEFSSNDKEEGNGVYQDLMNALVGFLIICLLSMGLAYLGGAWGN